MSYKIVTLALVALHALTSTALPPCVCTRNLTPVCGSDGKTYGNQCILDCEKSKTGRDITTAKTGPCETVTTCFCTYEYKPVCGTDGNTYPNRCSLGCERSALPDLDVVSEGACEDRVTQPPCICTDDLRYVCGTDGNTYDNACMLNCQTAKDPTLAVKSQGKCVDKVRVVEPVITKREVPVPPCICTAELNEVCGSDGVSYGNPCMLNCATANNPSLSIKSQGRCDNVQVANPIVNDQSKCVCPRNLKPVCGSDGVTYGNECLLKCAGAQVSLARSGSC